MQLPNPRTRFVDRLSRFWHDRAMVLKAFSFAIVGVINFAVDFGVFSFAYFVLKWPIIAANIAAWMIAVSGSYVMNSMFTFAAESGRQLRLKDYATFSADEPHLYEARAGTRALLLMQWAPGAQATSAGATGAIAEGT